VTRYLIELSHNNEHEACVRALQAVERFGSHLVTHLDWGCRSGVHAGWLIADLDSRAEADQMVPPELRQDARIVELTRFTRDEIAAMVGRLDQ